jgi:hypothetical protein
VMVTFSSFGGEIVGDWRERLCLLLL